MDNYYDTTQKKVIDFLIGFFGWLVLAGLLQAIPYLITLVASATGLTGAYMAIGIANIVFLIINLGLFVTGIILGFQKGRKWIAIGMLCTMLIPLLLVGACFGVLMFGGFAF